MPRILGVDFGLRRIGIALSDPTRSIAFPVEVYEPRGPEPDSRYYRELVRENEIDRIIVGLPLHSSGRESELASRARRFGEWLATVTDRPVVFFDERYSSVEAEQSLLAAGLSKKKRQARRDKLAAQIMLQGYLDAGSPDKEAAPVPLSDQDPNPS
jgi:putative holliday junction resolvase